MRQVLTLLAALAACTALLGLGSLAHTATSAGAHAPAPRRSRTVTLSPAVDDLSLAQLSFPRAARRARLAGGALRVSALAPFGDDYMVAGAVQGLHARVARVLVLVANRPSALLDPVHVKLRASAAMALGAPRVMRAGDPFTHPAAKRPALCRLALHGDALTAARLHVLGTRGALPAGLGAAAALADAYDVVCGLLPAAELSTLRSALFSAPTPPHSPAPGPGPVPQPEPTPTPPGCAPCTPAPGFACPLVRPDVCVTEPRAPAIAAGAH